MGRPVVHFEIGGKDPERLQAFYRELFDWKYGESGVSNYSMVEAGGEQNGINGALVGDVPPDRSNWLTFYVEVDDLEASVREVERLGGTIVVPPTDIPGARFALFNDPAGNCLGIISFGPLPAGGAG